MESAEHRADEELLILSTCNRTEIYLVGHADSETSRLGPVFGDGADRLAQLALGVLAEIKGLHAEELAIFDTLHGTDAVLHLFDVATGLDSVVLGDTQILQQLKDAFARAHTHHTVGAVLNTVMHAAFKAGRRARAETRIADGKVSVASAGVEAAVRFFGGSLIGKSALLVGAGKIGRLTVRQLIHHGLDQLVIANRTVAHAEHLAGEARLRGVTADVCALDAISDGLCAADFVITALCTDTEPILSASMVAAAWPAEFAAPNTAPRLILDLGMPANVAAEVGLLPGVAVVGVDDLDATASASRGLREAEVPAVRRIIAEEWHTLDDRDDAIKRSVLDALYRRFADLARREVARQAKHGIPTTEAELHDYSLRLVRKLLAPVSQHFSHHPQAAFPTDLDELKALVDFFGLHPDLTLPPPPK